MRYYRSSIGFGRPWTPMVKNLIIANAAVFVLQLLGGGRLLMDLFALDTFRVFSGFRVWQLVTYMFLHGSPIHLFFNMFLLWMLGSEMEEFFGKKEFLFYYLYSGVFAGMCVWLVDLFTRSPSVTVGASGAIFGILLAYGIVYARRQITLLVFLVLPVTMQARTLVIILTVMELFLGVSRTSTGVAHFAHLGGLLAGYLYLKFFRKSIRPYFYGKSLLGEVGSRIGKGREEDDRRRLDQILDKINRHGIHTLTEGERKFLDEMSRRRRH